MRGVDVLMFLVIMAVIVVLPSLFMRYKWQTLRHRERIQKLSKEIRARALAPIGSSGTGAA